jgi:hypothetical protein
MEPSHSSFITAPYAAPQILYERSSKSGHFLDIAWVIVSSPRSVVDLQPIGFLDLGFVDRMRAFRSCRMLD